MKKKTMVLSALMMTLIGCSHLTKTSGGANQAGGDQSGSSSSQGWQRGQGWGHAGKAEPKNVVVLFAFDRSTFSAADEQALRQQARYLVTHPNARVKIIGHTDERGSREYNMGLGWRRARAVATLLQQDGVSKRELNVTSFGAEKPVMMGHNETAYRQNRRVQVIYKRY